MDAAIRQPRRWTRAEYERLIDQGVFGPDERLELIEGEILAMTPQKSAHATAVRLVQRALERAFPSNVDVRAQLPFVLDDASEPEPDVVVVPGSPRDYSARHPSTALLIVEVSDTTLRFDRQVKGQLYAKVGLPEYWIVNLVDRVIEIYREPAQRDGEWAYRLVSRLGPDEVVQPATAPGSTIPVADLLP